MDMREKWLEVSDGKVDLRVIHSGQGGEEEEVLRKMRMGHFQAGGFTIAGLQNLTYAVVALAIPLLMESQEDLHKVRAAVGPDIEQIFYEKGYVLLHWVDMGWMRFFTPSPDPAPEAVTSYTYVEWGESALGDLWRSAGFPPGVRMNIADITLGLGRGRVEAINTAPLIVYGFHWFTKLDYMIDLPWAPLSGATLVDRRTWERIPEEVRGELLRIARETGDFINQELIEWERSSLEAMTTHGLEIIEPPPAVVDDWRRLFMNSWDLLRGDIIPPEIFDKALAAVGKGGGS
jgi:TRAP-type C4-dicarboxylate transport system substrate-binding protein